MKIAMIYDMIYPYNVGGAEVRNYMFAKSLVKRGHEVHFFGAKLWKGKNTIKKDGIVMHGVYTSRSLYKKSRRSYSEPIEFAIKLVKPLFKETFDIIDCTAMPFFQTFVCKKYSILKRVPLILTWHEVWDDYWNYYIGRKGFLARKLERIVSRLAGNQIVVSERTKKRLLRLNSKANIDIIPNTLQLDIIASAKPSKEKFDLMFAGRLLPHKKVDILMKSMVLVKYEFPDIKCLIVGKGPEKEKLVKLSNRLGLDKNIVFKDFLPEQKDVYSYMKSSKVFVFPSILEGFGIVVIEAMACGLPIIGVKHRWNASEDLINENKAGFTVELSPDNIAEKIITLLRNKRTYNKFSKNNILKSKKYSIEKIVKKLEKVYEKTI